MPDRSEQDANVTEPPSWIKDSCCPHCDQEPCCCEPCPCCGETDGHGFYPCHHCGKPMCECCVCNDMHFGCEAEVNGGLYIGPRPELDL